MTKHSFDKTDPSFIKAIRPALRLLYDYYFRVGFYGFRNVPAQPCLLVGNHNGIMGCEVLMLLEGWLRFKHKNSPRVLALAHDTVFTSPFFKPWMPKIGAIPAKNEMALEALEKRYSILVYPGGDRDCFRPYSQRASVDFDGRKGYARLALKSGLPIVPVVNVGGHEQAFILHRADKLALRLDFQKKFRIRGIPITLRGLPFIPGLFFEPTQGLALTAMLAASVFPLPAKMDFYFEKPIELSPAEKEESLETQVELLNKRTLDVITSRLKKEYAKPRLPVFGPLRTLC